MVEWYDVALTRQPASDRRRIGEMAAATLETLVGPLHDKTVEIHAGSAYLTALAGLSTGRQLQWYGANGRGAA